AMSLATNKPYGVNFLMPFLDRDAVVAAASCPLVEFFYADPDADLVGLVHSGGALASWQVGSADEARAAVDAGCDLVIVQGAEAGGHVRGTKHLADVLAETVSVVTIPVVAAGGIGDQTQVKNAIDAGASGVRIGTRFLAATESSAHPDYIAALIEATGDDTVLTEAFSVGWPNAPHRVLRSCVEAAGRSTNDFVATGFREGEGFPIPRFAPTPPSNTVTGDVAAMALYAGLSVDAVRSRQSAADIIAELCTKN
ncbi:MAG: NAD(P)H-dependent flavin oxidoreductase, partial [Actinomycetota bacterium]